MSRKPPPRQPNHKEKRELIRSRLKIASELSNRTIAKQLGTSHHTVGKIRQEMQEDGQISHTEPQKNDWINHPYLLAHPELLENAGERELRAIKAPGILDILAERGSLSAIYAQRLLNKRRKAERKAALVQLSSEDCKLIHADIRNGLPEISDKTVDLLLVDPPYSKEFLPLLSTISAIGSRVLRDTANLVVLYGNRHLPTAMQRLSEHMQYHWTMSYLTPAGGSPSPWLGVATHWKPLLWYRKQGHPYSGDLIYDIINTGKPHKKADKMHIWEQDIQGMAAIIERMTDPAMTVLDCCCGASTTGIACVQLGRRYIGVDIDEKAIQISRDRLAAALEQAGNHLPNGHL